MYLLRSRMKVDLYVGHPPDTLVSLCCHHALADSFSGPSACAMLAHIQALYEQHVYWPCRVCVGSARVYVYVCVFACVPACVCVCVCVCVRVERIEVERQDLPPFKTQLVSCQTLKLTHMHHMQTHRRQRP